MPISKVGSKGIKDAELTADDIAPGTITNAKIADSTIANAKLAGSIANSKLANSSMTLNGTAVALGGTADIGTQWQAEKTASFTAVAGEGYFINTTGGVVTVTLPASPSVGDEVDIVDSRGQFGTNNVTVNRNSSNIEGAASNETLSNINTKKKYVYSGATQGWIAVNDEVPEPEFITASGGTETTSGNFKVHTFASSGNFVVSSVGNQSAELSYLVVAGGGGAGTNHGAGGGAGGFRETRASNDTYTVSPLNAPTPNSITATAQTYPITVGGGGSGGADSNDGSNSVFSTITSAGGGQGGSNNGTPHFPGGPGGSGGGSKSTGTIGSGNTPPVSPPQGSNGGQGHPSDNGAGGGGGATAVGTPGASQPGGGPGGAGATTHISGNPVAYAGGGGANAQSGPEGTGGTGGGGNAANPTGGSGTANTGGGGGASTGSGGSGIVIIRYKNA